MEADFEFLSGRKKTHTQCLNIIDKILAFTKYAIRSHKTTACVNL